MALEKITQISAAQAAQAYAGVSDPAGHATAHTMANCADSFRLDAAGGGAVFSVTHHGKQLWITAAAGRATDDLTDIGLEVIEQTARMGGCTEVAFQTARRGLVRKAQKRGYTVAGWILKKAVE